MHIRPATENDAAAISALCEDVQRLHAEALPTRFKPASPETFPPERVRELMNTPDHIFFVAEHGDVVIGHIHAEHQSVPETPFRYAAEIIYVHQIGVSPLHRRSGAGRQLLEAVTNWAREQNIATVTLHTWAFNSNAIAFFEHQNFVCIDQRMCMRL
jgi:GNAT superfamily N-acetyltransferase